MDRRYNSLIDTITPQHVTYAAHDLPYAMLVFDQPETNIAITVLAKTDPGPPPRANLIRFHGVFAPNRSEAEVTKPQAESIAVTAGTATEWCLDEGRSLARRW